MCGCVACNSFACTDRAFVCAVFSLSSVTEDTVVAGEAIPAHGKRVEVSHALHFEFDRDGKVIKERAYWDSALLLEDLRGDGDAFVNGGPYLHEALRESTLVELFKAYNRCFECIGPAHRCCDLRPWFASADRSSWIGSASPMARAPLAPHMTSPEAIAQVLGAWRLVLPNFRFHVDKILVKPLGALLPEHTSGSPHQAHATVKWHGSSHVLGSPMRVCSLASLNTYRFDQRNVIVEEVGYWDSEALLSCINQNGGVGAAEISNDDRNEL
jgi:hypothetical protein